MWHTPGRPTHRGGSRRRYSNLVAIAAHEPPQHDAPRQPQEPPQQLHEPRRHHEPPHELASLRSDPHPVENQSAVDARKEAKLRGMRRCIVQVFLVHIPHTGEIPCLLYTTEILRWRRDVSCRRGDHLPAAQDRRNHQRANLARVFPNWPGRGDDRLRSSRPFPLSSR
eukprot:scaffold1883_cov261-Pinguiococcus_pyrenoidosus.AAC.42